MRPANFPAGQPRFAGGMAGLLTVTAAPLGRRGLLYDGEMTTSAPALNLVLDDLEDSGQLDDPLALYEAFSQWAQDTGRPLYPHQAAAAEEIILEQRHVIAATPTGSGKSLIALAAHFKALAAGQTSYYTAPLKALVSEKFFDLVAVFGAANVGMVTGDISLNAQAPIICCTAEILANLALRQGEKLDAEVVIMDEFHYYTDPQRGPAWQAPLLLLPQAQFVLLSATLGDVSFFVSDLFERTGRQVKVLDQATRPVPLSFSYSREPLPAVVERLVASGRCPAYLVHSSQKAAVSQAQSLAGIKSLKLLGESGQARIKEEIAGFAFNTGFGRTLKSLLLAGIGVHHAGMLPRYRRLVERLAQSGALPVICGTDTLGVGINVPIRTVVMTALVKFDGNNERHLSAREFHQIAGRAGRAGFDTEGFVLVQAPEWEIENAVALARAADDPKKLAKITKKKAPEGRTSWNEATFERLVAASPETMVPRWQITHSMVLSTLQRGGDSAAALLALATDNHEVARATGPAAARNRHLRDLGDVLTSLLQAGVVEYHPAPGVAGGGKTGADGEVGLGLGQWKLAREVPADFALNSPLSPFALAVLASWEDADSDEAALDVISVIEAVSEDPRPILYAQQDAAKGEIVAQLKAEGVDYDERMRILEQVTWPRPLEDQLGAMYQSFLSTNPWARGYEPSPKSVLRQMIESAATFSSFISRYDAARSEGILLRYLTDVYRALRQVVPDNARSARLEDIRQWLGRLITAVDRSLLDEWARLEAAERGEVTAEDFAPAPGGDLAPGAEEEMGYGQRADGSIDYARNPAALVAELRRQAFAHVEALALDKVADLARREEAAREQLSSSLRALLPAQGEAGYDQSLGTFWDEYEWIDTSSAARSAQFFHLHLQPNAADFPPDVDTDTALELQESGARGEIMLLEQEIVDDSGDQAWAWWAVVDLRASGALGRAVYAPLGLLER